MCGIVGVCGLKDVYDKLALKKIISCLEHRGPDGEGYYCENFVALGHRRLSIIDLEGGQQPIANEDETVVLVTLIKCFGWIYKEY